MTIKVISTTEPPKPVEAAKVATPVKEKAVETEAPAKVAAEKIDESETPEQEHEEEAVESKEETEESEETGEAVNTEQPKKKSGFQKRIDKLNKRVADKDRETEYWKAEALKAKPQETKPVEAKKETVAGKPNADDYTKHSDYVEALTDWKVGQAEAARETKQKAAQAQTEQQKQFATYNEGVKAVKERFADYDDVMEGADDIIAPPHIIGLLYESENGPELAYQLSKNRAELEKIIKLGPMAAAVAIGKFEAKHLSPPEENHESKTTNAPAPIKPVGSKGSASSTKTIWDADKLSQSEYEAIRAKQRAKKHA